MRLVPVFTLETNNQTNNECLLKFVQTDNASSSIKTAIDMETLQVLASSCLPQQTRSLRIFRICSLPLLAALFLLVGFSTTLCIQVCVFQVDPFFGINANSVHRNGLLSEGRFDTRSAYSHSCSACSHLAVLVSNLYVE